MHLQVDVHVFFFTMHCILFTSILQHDQSCFTYIKVLQPFFGHESKTVLFAATCTVGVIFS